MSEPVKRWRKFVGTLPTVSEVRKLLGEIYTYGYPYDQPDKVAEISLSDSEADLLKANGCPSQIVIRKVT